MTYADYLTIVARTRLANPEHRYGQVLFNVLFIKRPNLARKIRGGDLDPFHIANRVPAFLAYVEENW